MKPITTNQHLNNLISALLVATQSIQWQHEHQEQWPEGTAARFLEDFDRLVGAGGAGESSRSSAIEVLQTTLNQIRAADPELKSCRAVDLDWLGTLSQAETEVIDQVLATFWGCLHPMDEELTPQEALNAMAEHQRDRSVMNRRLRAGLVPGAVKRGRQWLIPKSSLIALGWLPPDSFSRRLGAQETIQTNPNRKLPWRPRGRR